jgi:Na+/H+-dicarboxylate symporter
MTDTPRRGMSLHNKILLGLVLGAACGITANLIRDPLEGWLTERFDRQVQVVGPLNQYVMKPAGDVFLNMLMLTVVPLVFSSLAVGVARLGDLSRLGRMGLKTFGFFALTMTLAVAIGLTLVNAFQPGRYLTEEDKQELKKGESSQDREKVSTGRKQSFGVETFVKIVPRNPIAAAAEMNMLAIIFFALLVGAGLTHIDPVRSRLIVEALDGVTELMVFIIGLAMRLAPYGVFAFLFRATSNLGVKAVAILGVYVFVVLFGLALHFFVSYPVLIVTFARMSPRVFFRKVRAVIVTAFSTSSSNATLPTSIKVAEEELGLPPQVAGFVLPLGATMNMNGTALFEGVTIVFLAQAFGAGLDFGQQMVVVVMSVLMAIGAAGIPGGSIPMLMIILATVNVDPENIALILGIDRILDMCRTTLNVVGDLIAATYVARSEGFELTPGKSAMLGSPSEPATRDLPARETETLEGSRASPATGPSAGEHS